MNLFSLFTNHATFAHGGVHPLEHKDETAGLPIRRMPFAPKLVVPLSQHKGAPAKPIVKAGQEVVRGEPVAVADGYVSVPMHAPATGRVSAVDLWATAEGPKAPAIVIDVYDGATQEVLYEDPVDIMHLAAEEIVQAVKDAGLVGLGGAAFPSHVKLLPPDGKSIHTVVVNGCECEPYLTCDHRVMLEHTDALLRGIRIVMRATGATRALIGVEDKHGLLDGMEVAMQALMRIADFIVRLTPVGVFAITAAAAGTMQLAEIQRLGIYVWSYVGIALLTALWILPGLVTTLTPLRYRQVMGVTRDALLTAFATGSLFVVLPMLVTKSKELIAQHVPDKDRAEASVEVIVPVSFNFPHAGKLFALTFVLFAGWYSGYPVEIDDFPAMAAAGLTSLCLLYTSDAADD